MLFSHIYRGSLIHSRCHSFIDVYFNFLLATSLSPSLSPSLALPPLVVTVLKSPVTDSETERGRFAKRETSEGDFTSSCVVQRSLIVNCMNISVRLVVRDCVNEKRQGHKVFPVAARALWDFGKSGSRTREASPVAPRQVSPTVKSSNVDSFEDAHFSKLVPQENSLKVCVIVWIKFFSNNDVIGPPLATSACTHGPTQSSS